MLYFIITMGNDYIACYNGGKMTKWLAVAKNICNVKSGKVYCIVCGQLIRTYDEWCIKNQVCPQCERERSKNGT